MTEPAQGAAHALRPQTRSFAFGVFEYLVTPLLLFLATPILLNALGEADFGLWLLLASVTGLVTVAGLGMGTATIRFVAHHRGRDEPEAVRAVIRHTLAVALAGGCVVGIPLFAAAPWIATTVLAKMGEADTVAAILRTGAIVILLAQIDSTFASTIRGFERFGTGALLEGLLRSGGVLVTVGVAAATRSIHDLLTATVAVTALGTVVRAVVVTRMTGGVPWLPKWSVADAGDVWRFGGWNGLNTLSSFVVVHLDRLIVGSTLGATALAHYGICIQLGSQIHAIPAAGLAFLLPLYGRRLAAGRSVPDAARVERNRVLVLTVAIATAAAGGLAILGTPILDLWVGPAIREAIEAPFELTILCYFLLALNIGPYFMLLGQGNARLVSLTSLAGSVASVLAALVLIPEFGLAGGIAAKTVYSVCMLGLYLRVLRPAHAARATARP